MRNWLRACTLGLVLALGWNLQAARLQDARTMTLRAQAGPSQAFPLQRPLANLATAEHGRQILNQYCVTCHNQRLKTAGLMLDVMDVEHVGEHAETWEKVVQKLRAGAMPPVGLPRPDKATYAGVASSLEVALDRVAAANPNPGRTTAHRLNRGEYANAVRDLLATEIDPATLLPPDDADLGFDNMADILSVSPALLERYMSAARKISGLAVGDPATGLIAETYTIPRMLFQDGRMDEDLPFGSRGGMAVRHYFPLDAEYEVKIRLRRQLYDYIRGLQNPQQLEVRLDGKLVKRFTVGGAPGTPPPESYAGAQQGDREWEDYTQHADDDLEVRFPVKAGPRVVGVSFVQARSERDGALQPRASGKLLAVAETWSSPSEAPEAAVDSVVVTGPFNAVGPGDTPSRRRIFLCHPSPGAAHEACAKDILSTIARRAFRRPVTSPDVATLLRFYRAGHSVSGFETGIKRGLESILIDPEFLFRIERDPMGIAPATAYPISDLELASRLSFFIWSSIPDDDLLEVAIRGELSDPAVLQEQVHRMLTDPRSKALVVNFASQWLSLRKLQSVGPTPELFVEFDDNLREGFQRETELFIESQLREDRSILDLLDANYTFVNERLARHYGLAEVYGSRFRRVTFPDDRRGGLLGHGSVLTVTSYPTRTSPVVRGHWLLENVLGAPPPPPPPNVPSLPERNEGGVPTSVRQRLEQHRSNAVCASCHAQMDPLGFALEHFDAIGKWRTTSEGGTTIDASGVVPDGTRFQGLKGLRTVLLDNPERFPSTVAEKLLTYALGRGLEYYDMPAVRQIVREAAPHDYSWSSLILGVVRSTPFQMRRSEP